MVPKLNAMNLQSQVLVIKSWFFVAQSPWENHTSLQSGASYKYSHMVPISHTCTCYVAWVNSSCKVCTLQLNCYIPAVVAHLRLVVVIGLYLSPN